MNMPLTARLRQVAWPMILTAMLVLSCSINLIQGRRIDSLKAVVTQLRSEGTLKAGDVVGPLVAETLGGNTVAIQPVTDGRPTVIYVYSPKCRWCSKNLANFHALVDQAGNRFHFVTVSTSDVDVPQYLAASKIVVPAYFRPSPGAIDSFKLGATPHTIVMSSDGTVAKSWVGAFTEGAQKEVESYFRVTLPGLSDVELPAEGGSAPRSQES